MSIMGEKGVSHASEACSACRYDLGGTCFGQFDRQLRATVHGQTIGDVDCDGSASSIDASLILQFSAGLVASLPCGGAADPNGDGRTTAVDSTLILQFVAGFIHDLPGEKPPQPLLGRPGVIKFIGSGSIYQGPRGRDIRTRPARKRPPEVDPGCGNR